MARIFVTGATGFIGKRLLYSLLEKGHEVVALVRQKGPEFKAKNHSKLHFIYGDLLSIEETHPLLEKIDAAYYLMHSMGNFVEDLVDTETKVAKRFISLLEKTSVKQIIFLGGIIEEEQNLSPHLSSRLAVEKILSSSSIPFTILRASLIIGSGSASFEIIRDLSEKLPIMIAPKWILTYCQPIAIRDVIFYLENILLLESAYWKTLDIGGPKSMTFKEILQVYAKERKLKRVIIHVPVLTPKLSTYWLVFITSVRYSLCKYLVESMKHPTRKLNRSIDTILPHECLTYEQSLQIAFQKISQNEVVSTWMDASDPKKLIDDFENYIEAPTEGCFKEMYERSIPISLETVKNQIWSIGGNNGWYAYNFAWRLRGLTDKLMGGIGMNRGRRHPTEIEVGDSIDFWRVILANKTRTRLILYAEMKLPGEAWLEFEIVEEQKILKQTVTFRPRGSWGRLYWYLLLPIHKIIFNGMINALVNLPPLGKERGDNH